MVLALVAETGNANAQAGRVAMVYATTPLGGALISLLSMLLAPTQWRVMFVVGGVVPLILAPIMAFALPGVERFSANSRGPKSVAIPPTRPVCPNPEASWPFTPVARAAHAIFMDEFFPRPAAALLAFELVADALGQQRTESRGSGGCANRFQYRRIACRDIDWLSAQWPPQNWAVVVTFVSLPILLVALAKSPPQLAIICITVFLLGCAIIAAQAFLYAMAPAAYPTSIRGVGVGAAVAMGRIGSIAGPKLGGVLKAAGPLAVAIAHGLAADSRRRKHLCPATGMGGAAHGGVAKILIRDARTRHSGWSVDLF